MLEKIDEILNVLQGLKDETTKQQFFSAPDIEDVFKRIGAFMQNELDTIIQTAEEIKAELEESA